MLQQNILSLKNYNFNYKMYLTITLYNVKIESEFIIKFIYNNNNYTMQKTTHSLQRDTLLKLDFRESPNKIEINKGLFQCGSGCLQSIYLFSVKN